MKSKRKKRDPNPDDGKEPESLLLANINMPNLGNWKIPGGTVPVRVFDDL